MKITDIIRSILDVIDGPDSEPEVVDYEEEVSPMDELSRVVQLAGNSPQLANSPDEQYADQAVIFTVGDDMHKPKHPSDLRADSFSMYPNTQYDPGQ